MRACRSMSETSTQRVAQLGRRLSTNCWPFIFATELYNQPHKLPSPAHFLSCVLLSKSRWMSAKHRAVINCFVVRIYSSFQMEISEEKCQMILVMKWKNNELINNQEVEMLEWYISSADFCKQNTAH